MELNTSLATDLATSPAQPTGFHGAQLTTQSSAQPPTVTLPYPSRHRPLPTINCNRKCSTATAAPWRGGSKPERSCSVILESVGCQPWPTICDHDGSVCTNRPLTFCVTPPRASAAHWAADGTG